MGGNKNKYGHISRAKKQSKAWRWAIALAVCLWSLAVCVWNTGRMAALFGYHPALGSAVFTVGEYRLYWPWKLVEWAERFQQYEQVTRVVDQTYLMGVGLPLILFLIYMASQQGLKGRDDLHGSAKWAERKDIDKMGYLKNEGVYVGGWYDEKAKIHYYLRHNGPEHILCFAPTRSGKGVGLILPTLLAWEHSSIVLDIKGENYALTTGHLKTLGHKTLRFDPSDSEGASAAFNPLEEIRLNSPLSIPDVQQISMMVMDPGGKGLEDYWSKSAFSFFGGAVLHCLLKTRYEQKRVASLYDVAVMLEDPARPVKELFNEMLKMDHASMMAGMFPELVMKRPNNPLGQAAHVYIASAARGMLSKADNELSGVVNTATSNLALYKDPIVAMNISRCDFRLNDLMNHEAPVNLYLVISPADIDRLRPLMRIFVAQMLGRITEKMEFENGTSKAAYKHRLLLMLDEFTSLGKISIIERAVAYMAGYGCKAYFIVQDTKQLTQAYGTDNALMANCHIRIVYAPNLPETAEYLSKMAGVTTVVDKKISISGGVKGGKSRSVSISETSRPLLTADECLRLPGQTKDDEGDPVSGDMLIFTAGHPPIYGRQILYFIDPVFSARAKIKTPGVAEGWSRGLSDSLYFPMPLIEGDGPLPAQAVTIEAEYEEGGDFDEEYQKLLDA